MTLQKSLILALFGIGIAVTSAGCMPPKIEPNVATAEGALRPRRFNRDRHNRAWKNAQNRARALARRGGKPRDIAREFQRSLVSSPDININVCIQTAINNVNAAAVGNNAGNVVNVINSFNCAQ